MLAAHFDVLVNDADLMNILTGGIYNQAVDNEISKVHTPAAFDPATEELLPCGLFKSSLVSNIPATFQGATRTEIEVYLYQRNQYLAVASAADRIYQLWHDQIIVPDNVNHQTFRTLFNNEIPNGKDDVLGCNVYVVRYNVIWYRFGAISTCGE